MKQNLAAKAQVDWKILNTIEYTISKLEIAEVVRVYYSLRIQPGSILYSYDQQ